MALLSIPLMVAVPLRLSVNVMPPKSTPSTDSVGVGVPVATTVKFAGTPLVTFIVSGEMIESSGETVMVKVCDTSVLAEGMSPPSASGNRCQWRRSEDHRMPH